MHLYHPCFAGRAECYGPAVISAVISLVLFSSGSVTGRAVLPRGPRGRGLARRRRGALWSSLRSSLTLVGDSSLAGAEAPRVLR